MVVGIIKSTEEQITEKMLQLLELIEYKPSKNKIFLKPNVMSPAHPGTGVNTHPLIIETLWNYFKDQGFEVIIGEGPSNKTDPKDFKSILKSAGYKELADKAGIINLNHESVERVGKTWEYGKLMLPKLLEDHEYINIACMKTHWTTTVSLGLKNQKGLLLPIDKKKFHKLGLHEPIVKFNEICTPDLTIIDGIYCLEGTGPTLVGGGKTRKMDLLIAGRDVIEVDNVCCEIMGFNADSIKHIPKVDFQTIGETIDNVKSKFEKPKNFLAFPFGKSSLRIYIGDSSCSQMSEILVDAFLKLTKNRELVQRMQNYKRIDISTGGAEFPPNDDTAGIKICVGECSKAIAEKLNLIHIKGCPINPDELVNILSKKLL